MAGIGDFFGQGTIGEQLLVWGLLNQLIGALADPAISELQQDVRSASQVEPLSPADLAAAVNRSYRDPASAAGEAGRSGIDAGKFTTLTQLSGSAPGPSDLVEALRRGYIPAEGDGFDSTSFIQGIREGNLHDKWAPMMQKLALQIPSQAQAIDALIKGQIDKATAQQRYTEAGGDPTWFDTAFTTSGASPSAVELGRIANRGLIPWTGTGPQSTSFQQGIYEGAYRDKWLDVYRALAVYLPPPRTVTAMLKEGALTSAQALQLWQESGLSSELAGAYLASAGAKGTSGGKALTESTVVALYEDKLLSEADALTHLEALKYSATDAKLLLALADLKAATTSTRTATNRVRALYVGRDITATQAEAALVTIGLTQADAAGLVATWTSEKGTTVKRLTEGQIASAMYYKVLTQDEAMAELADLGYSEFDAWVVLSERNHGPLPGKPAGPATAPGALQ